LTKPKSDVGEIEKAMFEGLLSHFEIIFGLLIITKCDLVEVEKTMFQGFTWHFNGYPTKSPSYGVSL